MPVGSTPSPWLEKLPPGANFAEVTLYVNKLGDGIYDTDVPRDTFYDIMRRAARHDGYSARYRQFKSYHARDMTFEMGSDHKDVRVIRRRLLSVHEIPGASLYACVYDSDRRAPMSSFSCGAKLHDVRHVRRLSLRAHRRAKLVFEVHRNDVGKVVRRVFLEIVLDDDGNGGGGGGGASLASDMPDLRRTVENTVHLTILSTVAKDKKKTRNTSYT